MSEAMVSSTQQALRVLLLEDSSFDAELVSEALRRAVPHVQLQRVADEDGFLDALQAPGLDLILSDYELPGFSGHTALQHARRLVPQVPFIFVSGVIGEDNAVELMKQGATDYVSKGRLARLPVVIERALREARDRAARLNAERQLREAGAVFARVVDALQDYAVVLLDTEGRVRSWNRAAREIFGFSAEDMIGVSADVLFVPEDRLSGVFEQELRQALAHGKADDSRWMMRVDGSRLWAEGTVMPLFDDADAHSGFVKVVHDATDAHERAASLKAAKEEAERANRAKDRFLAMLSHELRTPLAPIASAAHILARCAQVPEKYRHLLPMIERNVALEARLIEDLLDLTAISAGKLILRRERVDMHKLVQRVVEMLADAVRDRQLQLQLHLGARQPEVQGDEARLQQVVWNLLRNAVKFTPEGGRIEVQTSDEAGQFVLRCVDSGIGIEPQALPRLFTPFEQADAEVSQRFGGLGLGLAIAQRLVTEHQGRLEAASAGRGQGATFTLRLPTAAAASPARHRAPVQPPGAVLQGRVLLVEDNADAAEALVLSLEHYGYGVTHVPTCSQALQAAATGAFDAVITDLGLPDGSGIEVGRALAARLPVVALSGYGAAPDVGESQAVGFAAHLVKPVDPSAVHALLQQLLGRGAA